MKWIKRLVILLVVLLVVAVAVAAAYFIREARPASSAPEARVVVPRFRQVALDFVHRFDAEKALPFLGSAVIDIDGDGREEIFLGGGVDQDDALFRFDGDGFVAIDGHGIVKQSGDATYGALSLDVDDDGAVDLLVTRDSGLSLHRNIGGRFTREEIETGLHAKSVGLSLAATDLDLDGIVDLFLAAYIRPEHVRGLTVFNDPTYGGRSVLLRGRADGSFENVTQGAGLEVIHNTFDAVFSDADGDGRPDLIVAYDTGKVGTWRNASGPASGLKFVREPNPSSDVFSYPMGIATGDVNGDGLTDFFFSNTGSTVPTMLARGDLRDDQVLETRWFLFESRDDFTFANVATARSVADYEFGWGSVFEDFNLDGLLDLVVSENFVDFPPHKLFKLPGRFLVQNPDGRFAPVESEAGAANHAYGIAPLVADFDGDGYPDLVHVNLAGPTVALINEGGDARWLKVALPDGIRALGARIRLTISDGRVMHHEVVAGEGLASDQTHVAFFGLESGEARSIEVTFTTGEVVRVENPEIRTTIRVDRPDPADDADATTDA